MCTVTFLPLRNNNFILTSNRDETPLRKTASPKVYLENETKLLYPKDVKAGGTWIGASSKKRVVCLLNGAFTNHQRKNEYRMSRGVIVKKMLVAVDAVTEINQFTFVDIEPFTLIFIDFKDTLAIYELVWDGTTKHFKQLENKPQIWSSPTLYTEDMQLERAEWFDEWLQENDAYTPEAILEFHQDSSKGSQETAVKMKRTFVETVSITSIKKKDKHLTLCYFDLLNNTFTKEQMK